MKKSFKPGAMLCPVPAVMVSCGTDDEKNIITIAWTGIINSNPPITYISVRPSRHSHEIIEKNREFVINLTDERLAFATDYCGVKSGRDVDKFKEMNLTALECEQVACPMIAESPVNLECKVIEVKKFPTHDMFIAEIVAMHASDTLVDEKGKINLGEEGLVSYIHGEYFAVKKAPLGKFGYSIMKAKTKKRINREKHAERTEKNRLKRTKGAKQKESKAKENRGKDSKLKDRRAKENGVRGSRIKERKV